MQKKKQEECDLVFLRKLGNQAFNIWISGKTKCEIKIFFFYLNQILTHTLGVVTISDLRCLLDSFTVVDFIAKTLVKQLEDVKLPHLK